jgi:hypothetical protein
MLNMKTDIVAEVVSSQYTGGSKEEEKQSLLAERMRFRVATG